MDVPQKFEGEACPPNSVSGAGSGLPECGTLGPGSDIGITGAEVSSHGFAPKMGPTIAVCAGVLLAVFVVNIGHAHAAWRHISSLFSPLIAPNSVMADAREIDSLKPQKQAETLLELAVGNSDGAVQQISAHVDRWQGKLKWDSQMATLTTAALNSSDLQVRESGVEVELAAYGLSKNAASLKYLLQSAQSEDHALKIWALWALGLMANRGVETEHIVRTLTAHLQDADEDSRRWAVEGLALSGSSLAIEPLLKAIHDDATPTVRERAACSLARSGMFTREQRMAAVPQLLNLADDPSLDAQTHTWTFQALAEITNMRLPNDATAWREWYQGQPAE